MELVHPPAPTLHTKHALPPPFPLPPLSFPDLASVAPPPDIYRIKHWIAAGSFLCQIPGPCGGGGKAELRCVESRRAPICPPGLSTPVAGAGKDKGLTFSDKRRWMPRAYLYQQRENARGFPGQVIRAKHDPDLSRPSAPLSYVSPCVPSLSTWNVMLCPEIANILEAARKTGRCPKYQLKSSV